MTAPIETIREGNKITKVCVEDVYKLLNRIMDISFNSYNKVTEIVDSIHKEYGDYEGEIIIGKGTSEPCGEDEFNEKIGNEIAFRKAKLNANLKKRRLYYKIFDIFMKSAEKTLLESEKLNTYIADDLRELRKYNSDFRPDLGFLE